ncbi:hypothetical protein Q8H44_07495, partial [Acinetobacter lwoffii]|nr:hypothetical protein [Acinetobacter lwoffii]
MFCLRNQDITDAKAFFYLFFMSNSGYLKFQKPEISSSEPITPQIAGLSAVSDNSAWILGLKMGYHF